MHFVYVLLSKKRSNQLYIGFTTNLEKRFKEHNKGLVQSTKPYCPWKIIFFEVYISKRDAKRREEYFKTSSGRRTLRLMLRDTLNIKSR